MAGRTVHRYWRFMDQSRQVQVPTLYIPGIKLGQHDRRRGQLCLLSLFIDASGMDLCKRAVMRRRGSAHVVTAAIVSFNW